MHNEYLDEKWNELCDLMTEVNEGTKKEADIYAFLESIYEQGWTDRGVQDGI